MAIERAASIVGLQSVESREQVLVVHQEVVDGSLAQYSPRPLFHITSIYFESKSGRRQSAVFVTVDRAASIVGLQSVGSIERVLIVYREGVDGSLAQYFPSTTFSHHLYIF